MNADDRVFVLAQRANGLLHDSAQCCACNVWDCIDATVHDHLWVKQPYPRPAQGGPR
jgi:hypothetical protein